MIPPDTAPAMPLGPELEDYRAQLDAVYEAAESLLEGLDDAQFNWRPEAGTWSIAQCLGHLSVAGEAYLGPMEEAIAMAREDGLIGKGPFRYGLLEGLFVRSMEPPARLKVKNARAFTPPPEQPLEAGKNAFFAVQSRIARNLEEAEGLHLAKVKVRSPLSPLIKLSLGSCFALLLAHERRHLQQARRVREDPRFPSHE